MTSIQKIIKYAAIAFAIFLIVTIISTILGLFYAITGVLVSDNDTNGSTHTEEVNVIEIRNENMETVNIANSNIGNLEIDLFYTNLLIKSGNELKFESNNTNIMCQQKNDTLKISEKKHDWFSKNNDEISTLFLPETMVIEKFKINAGAGKITIDKLITNELSFELGAGETVINSLNVLQNCKLEGGAGKITINSGVINNFNLDMGVGEANVTARLINQSEINAGVGSLNLNLEGTKEEYTLKVNKGIGSIKVNSEEAQDATVIGNGPNYIKVDGGIGSIKINNK